MCFFPDQYSTCLDEATSRITQPPHGGVAGHELLVVTELLRMCLVPTRAREDAGSRLHALGIGDEFRAPLDGAQSPIHASPIA